MENIRILSPQLGAKDIKLIDWDILKLDKIIVLCLFYISPNIKNTEYFADWKETGSV